MYNNYPLYLDISSVFLNMKRVIFPISIEEITTKLKNLQIKKTSETTYEIESFCIENTLKNPEHLLEYLNPINTTIQSYVQNATETHIYLLNKESNTK